MEESGMPLATTCHDLARRPMPVPHAFIHGVSPSVLVLATSGTVPSPFGGTRCSLF